MLPLRFALRITVALLLSFHVLGQGDFVNFETPHVRPLTLTPNEQYLIAVNTPDNRLEIFEIANGTPVHAGSIPVGLDPVSVSARANGEVWVVNHLSDSISIVDLSTLRVKATLATDDEPCDVVFAGQPEKAFVSCSRGDTILVFNPTSLSTAPTQIKLDAQEPRAMAVSTNGEEVYVAIFESGNGTTVLGGGAGDPIASPPNVVNDPAGPWNGLNPPPNDGSGFKPPFNPLLPAPPGVSLIVRLDGAGMWMDDNGGDWTNLVSGNQAQKSGRPVGWELLDHDIAILDANTLSVSYADGLMNLNMALAVNPVTNHLAVVGTEAINELRFEPNVNGIFVRSHLALINLATSPPAASISDMNNHLDYSVSTLPQSERTRSLGDPRGVAWNGAGDKIYVTGMGSNNVIVLDETGNRIGLSETIEVGEGPTGIVVSETHGQAYVLNKFSSSISVLDLSTETVVSSHGFFDPSPLAIKQGRRHL